MAEEQQQQSLNTARLFESVVHTDIGRRRRENQDSYCVIERPEYCFYALADGMGGLAGGSAASGLAIATAKDYLDTKKLVSEPVLREAVRVANKRVFEQARDEPMFKAMGTTFVALAFAGADMFVANVGDSRAYRFRQGRLTRLTEDHTFRALLERSGVVSFESARENPMSHLLTRSVGTAEEVEIDCWRSSDPPLANDIYLLCTDGLHNYLKEYEIARELETCPFDEVAEKFIDIANERGGSDNITVIATRVLDRNPVKLTIVSEANRSELITARRPEQSAKSLVRTRGLPLVFASGLALGALLFNIDWMAFPEKAIGSTDRELAWESENSALGEPILPPIDIATLSAEGSGEALAQLQKNLKHVQHKIEIATGKLSVWHKRREDFFSDGNSKALAANVAVNVSSVKKKVEALEHADWEYLREAENLIYNPANFDQEERVSQLRTARNEKAAELRAEMQRVIDSAVSRELHHIRHLSAHRDRLQTAVETIQQRIGIEGLG